MKKNKKNIIILFFIFYFLLFIFYCLYKQCNFLNIYEKLELKKETRNAYLLTCDENSDRAKFSNNILEKIGFNVNIIKCIKNENKVLSNKNSMIYIYELIANGNDDWGYVFEDDINILENIDIKEIIEYEKISDIFFYLGLCVIDSNNDKYSYLNKKKINNHDVTIIKGNIRGLHSIALSKYGAKELLSFLKNYEDFEYMDMILEKFSEKYPANVVRFDLEYKNTGHRGIFFQDREQFQTTI